MLVRKHQTFVINNIGIIFKLFHRDISGPVEKVSETAGNLTICCLVSSIWTAAWPRQNSSDQSVCVCEVNSLKKIFSIFLLSLPLALSLFNLSR